MCFSTISSVLTGHPNDVSLLRNSMQASLQKHTYSGSCAITSVLEKHKGSITWACDVCLLFCFGVGARSKMTGACNHPSSLVKFIIWYVAALLKKLLPQLLTIFFCLRQLNARSTTVVNLCCFYLLAFSRSLNSCYSFG